MPERITPNDVVDRRTVLKRGLALGLASIPVFQARVSSKDATPVAEPLTSGYQLTEVGDELIDEQFLNSKQGIKLVRFSYDPNTTGGSLEVSICTNNPDDVTLVLREVKPSKGYLFNDAFPIDTTCVNTYPAPYLEVNDVEEVLIGQGKDENGNYKDMRLYQIKREEKGLSGEFKGLESVDPKKIRMRDEGIAAG